VVSPGTEEKEAGRYGLDHEVSRMNIFSRTGPWILRSDDALGLKLAMAWIVLIVELLWLLRVL